MIIVFFGSSDFSVAAAQACLDAGHKINLAVTTPDQKKGRGLKLAKTVVKTFAEENNIPVISPPDLKDETVTEQIRAVQADLFVVSSYGKFIPGRYLSMPKIVPLNVHPSLIPKYRGCAPINSAILNGDAETGVSIIEVARKLDAGDIFFQKTVAVPPRINAIELGKELAQLSYEAVQAVLEQIQKDKLKRTPQCEKDSTYSPKINKEDGYARLDISSEELDRKIRGLKPWPGCHIDFQGSKLEIVEAEPISGEEGKRPGEILEIHKKEGAIDVSTEKGLLRIRSVKPAGKKEMPAAAFINGKRLGVGSVLE